VETINLGTAGNRITLKAENGNDYFIDIVPGKYLLIVACVEYGRAGFDFDHQNVIARIPRVFEYKHYRQGGSKFWTSAPGIELAFAIPKTAIEVVPEPGYSYVKVKIGGADFTFNVSGGTGTGGWTDRIGQSVHLCGTRKITKKQLRALASVAFDPAAAVLYGVRLNDGFKVEGEHAWKTDRFPYILAKKIVPEKIKPGVLVHLLAEYNGSSVYKVNYRDHGIEYNGKAKQKQAVILDYKGMNLRAKFNQIDWARTAEINGWALTVLSPLYRIPFEKTA
jgi:hypothetical protein